MNIRLILALILCSTLPAVADSPIAEVVCAPRAEMVDRLTHMYGASLAASGIRDVEAVMEVWSSPRGDWTLVQTDTDGRTCILAMGAAWDMPKPRNAG